MTTISSLFAACPRVTRVPARVCDVAGYWYASSRVAVGFEADDAPTPPLRALFIDDSCRAFVTFYSDIGPRTQEWERPGTIYFVAESLQPHPSGLQSRCGDETIVLRRQPEARLDLLEIDTCGTLFEYLRCPAVEQPDDASYDAGCREYHRYREFLEAHPNPTCTPTSTCE